MSDNQQKRIDIDRCIFLVAYQSGGVGPKAMRRLDDVIEMACLHTPSTIYAIDIQTENCTKIDVQERTKINQSAVLRRRIEDCIAMENSVGK